MLGKGFRPAPHLPQQASPEPVSILALAIQACPALLPPAPVVCLSLLSCSRGGCHGTCCLSARQYDSGHHLTGGKSRHVDSGCHRSQALGRRPFPPSLRLDRSATQLAGIGARPALPTDIQGGGSACGAHETGGGEERVFRLDPRRICPEVNPLCRYPALFFVCVESTSCCPRGEGRHAASYGVPCYPHALADRVSFCFSRWLFRAGCAWTSVCVCAAVQRGKMCSGRVLAQWQALVGSIGSGAGRRGYGSLQRSSGENWSPFSGQAL